MRELAEPIGDVDVGDRRMFSRQVVGISLPFIDLMMEKVAEAMGNPNATEMAAIRAVAEHAMGSYIFYRTEVQVGNPDYEASGVRKKLQDVVNRTRGNPATADNIMDTVDGAIEGLLKARGVSDKPRGGGRVQ